MIYKIFWIGYGLAAAGVLLHIFHILVPFLNIDPRMYAEIKADSEMRTDFHKRHLLYGILILFCIEFACFILAYILSDDCNCEMPGSKLSCCILRNA